MRILVTGYLIILHVVLGLYMYRGTPKHGEQYIAERRELLRIADLNKPKGAVVFLGDSLTESLATANIPNSVNYGIGWSTTKDLNERMGDYDFTDCTVVLMIGTNDATLHKTPEPINLPDVPILWYAVPPIDERYGVNDAIRKMNEEFKAQCIAHPRCTFIDLGPLPHIEDGVHLSKDGYKVWLHSLYNYVRS